MLGIDTNAGFIGSLAATLVLLALVVWSGATARLRVHLPAVAATLALLVATIAFAKQLGHRYDLSAAGVVTPIHLAVAKIATAAYLLPLVTGAMTLRDRKWRRLHLAAAIVTLALTVFTAVTGTLMICWATKL